MRNEERKEVLEIKFIFPEAIKVSSKIDFDFFSSLLRNVSKIEQVAEWRGRKIIRTNERAQRGVSESVRKEGRKEGSKQASKEGRKD